MDNCARFEDGSCLCAECAPGNQLTAWKQCLACEPNPHCTEPQPNSCDCTACEAGYTTPRCAPVSSSMAAPHVHPMPEWRRAVAA